MWAPLTGDHARAGPSSPRNPQASKFHHGDMEKQANALRANRRCFPSPCLRASAVKPTFGASNARVPSREYPGLESNPATAHTNERRAARVDGTTG